MEKMKYDAFREVLDALREELEQRSPQEQFSNL